MLLYYRKMSKNGISTKKFLIPYKLACFCKKGLGPVHDICEVLQYLSESIAELKQKITSKLVPHEIKDIIEDIHKLLQAIHEIITYHKMTWIEETKMHIFTAIVYSDHDKLLDFHSSPGNGLPSDVVFFALVVKNIDMIEFLLVDLNMKGIIIMPIISRTKQKKRE